MQETRDGTGMRMRNGKGRQDEDGVGNGHRGERAPGFPAELYRLSLGGLRTAQSPSTKKRWPTGWQSHCMASGTEPLCAWQAWRALLRKKRCGEGEMGCHNGPWAETPVKPGAHPMTQCHVLCSPFPR